MTRTILFGSIGTLAETSELQRRAFNDAFAAHGLDWNWGRSEYSRLLGESGGRDRIAEYARSRGQSVDADAIHADKSERFREMLHQGHLDPRPGVVPVLEDSERTAFVSATSRENIDAIFSALAPLVTPKMFDLITDASMVERPKPNPDIYLLALERLGVSADNAIAIEDNPPGAEAARQAGLKVIAFPGEMHLGASFGPVEANMSELTFATA